MNKMYKLKEIFLKHLYQSHYFFVVLILLSLFSYNIIMSAWLGDDSFISLTQIVNLHNGDGLVFNFQERVQAFTHPTWFFLLSIVTYFSGEYYNTILIISFIFSIFSIIVILGYAYKFHNMTAAFLALSILLFSKAFIDYTTSGLENPLSYLLFSLMIYLLLNIEKSNNLKISLYSIYLLMVFIFLNRMDYALILFPIAMVLLFEYKLKTIMPIVLSFSIALIWFLFSLFYFGRFFPNTYYAKLQAGYSNLEFFQRGVHYFIVQFDKDPVTLIIIILGVSLGFFHNKKTRAISIGIILYLLYFLKSGGDFMQGRFFAIPSLIATFNTVIYFTHKRVNKLYYIFTLALISFTANQNSPIFVNQMYTNKKFEMGIADERGFYYEKYGFLSPNRKWPNIVKLNNHMPTEVSVLCGGLGMAGLSSRNNTFYIDNCALTDPLLSQLPAISDSNWRIGHQLRKIPTDYTFAVIDDSVDLADENLDILYNDIKKVSRGHLLDKKRLLTIFNINYHNYNIEKTRYRNPNQNLEKSKMIPNLIPKQIYKFNTNKVAFHGWSSLEVTHRWTLNNQSSIDFKLDPINFVNGRLVLNIATLGQQTIKIKINNVLIKIFKGNKNWEDDSLIVDFDKSILKNINQLEFILPTARKPNNSDARILAMALKSFSIE